MQLKGRWSGFSACRKRSRNGAPAASILSTTMAATHHQHHGVLERSSHSEIAPFSYQLVKSAFFRRWKGWKIQKMAGKEKVSCMLVLNRCRKRVFRKPCKNSNLHGPSHLSLHLACGKVYPGTLGVGFIILPISLSQF